MQYCEMFADGYLDQIFYFCLKKTGNVNEAEELTGSICVEVLTSLYRGSQPHNFSAWVWKIARNCYAGWADKKYKASLRENVSEEEYLNIADGTDMDKELIFSEDLMLLRRELSLIRKEYREILVAHYLENKSVSTIADELSVPVGTVKTRLQSSRKKLKEGMNMAREFGIRSYNPEEVSFVMTAGMEGEKNPFELIKRKIPKNILLETYRNPATVEQLSLELGIASAYLEEEVEILVQNDFLKEVSGKYQTNFCIVSSKAQADIYERLEQDGKEIAELLEQYLDAGRDYFENKGIRWNYGFQSYESMKWTMLMRMADRLWEEALMQLGIMPDENYPVHPDGSNWIITGYEEYHGTKPEFVSLCGCISEETGDYSSKVTFARYYLSMGNPDFKNSPMLGERLALVLQKLAKGEASDCRQEDIQLLSQYGYVVNGQPNICVFTRHYEEETEELKEMHQRLVDQVKGFMQYYSERIRQDCPVHLKKDKAQIGNAFRGFILRGALLERALQDGYLKDGMDCREMLGVYMVI